MAKSAKFSTLLLDFVALNPVHKFIIGISLYRYSSNQFPNKILPIKSALASTFIYSNFQDFLLYFFAANYLFRSDPQPELADRSLMTAHNCMLVALEVQKDYFEIEGLNEAVQSCCFHGATARFPIALASG